MLCRLRGTEYVLFVPLMFYFSVDNTCISVLYVTAHRCAGSKRRFDLRSEALVRASQTQTLTQCYPLLIPKIYLHDSL